MTGWREDVKFYGLDFEQAGQYGQRLITLWGREAARYEARHAARDKRIHRALITAIVIGVIGFNLMAYGIFW